MPFQVRTLFIAALLSAGPILAQTTPSRPLLDEMLTAEQRAHPATVRTQYAVGNAFMVDGTTVIAALHSVLTPEGVIADKIGIGFPRPPLNNLMQSRSVPVAQDPDHDLILLEIKDYRPRPTPVADLPTAICPDHLSAPTKPHTAPSRARLAHRAARLSARTFAFREHPRLNIVYDGPGKVLR